ncbi:hypothetical protein WEN_00625 [Mycoplasma wenyonii str. Massachusetts]|uniref:Uncharacterized protein n=1 Tax=Mycoplasma wenyonii (strain Massachusetts) TaxID=1197325 RepID=I6ZID0_MYCWM|nr:hypothetical protein [Mycoplasma wenyonii]AFN64930.1 hypothetical protein WEN_00625 [Mycoplasma wenyonii str. Massachusetts]
MVTLITRGGDIQVERDKDSFLFNSNNSLNVKKAVSKDIKRNSGLVKDLNRTSLGVYRWQSEGVSEDILFVEGWDNAGQHKTIESKKHSQAERELWGGRDITYGNSWFGPRSTSIELDNLERAGEATKNSQKNYWTEIQKSGKYVTKEDLEGLQEYWKKRNKALEEDIFGLYHGWEWWADKFGKKKDGKLVDLEFDLSKLKDMLGKTEAELRDSPWNYGQVFQNPKLAKVRFFGDVEATAFNYLKKYIWPTSPKVQSLSEKNILPAIVELLFGGDNTGWNCQEPTATDNSLQSKFFGECVWNTRNNGDWKVKKVLKSAYKNNNGFWVPQKGRGGGWNGQQKLEDREKDQVLKMDSVQETGLLDEKCEKDTSWWGVPSWSDPTNGIRREVCDQIIRPWFGDTVNDKRLCLIEVKDYSYHLRLQTYLEVLQVPAWLSKNTFWTKCSNYRI